MINHLDLRARASLLVSSSIPFRGRDRRKVSTSPVVDNMLGGSVSIR